MKTKQELLDHYAKTEPHEFYQYDAFVCEGWDCVIRPDDDGHGLTACRTEELMSGLPRVRVLIVPDTPPAEIVELLLNIAAWIERDPTVITQAEESLPF